MEAQIFENRDVAVVQARDRVGGLGSDAILGEGNRSADDFGQRVGDGLERHFRVGLALGPAEVGEYDDAGPFLGEFKDGRRGAFKARQVGDASVLHRHVQIGAHQNALSPDIEVVDSLEGFGHGLALPVSAPPDYIRKY